MTYGAITPKDVEVLELVMSDFKNKKMKFLEIGVYAGATARGIRDFCKENNISLQYWGIEKGSICEPKPPFEEARFIVGDSIEVFHLVPNDFDVVFLDGCHCLNHVILEVYHYEKKVKQSGYILFHDTSPNIQQTMKDPHGPNIPEFHNSVNLALETIKFPFPNWICLKEAWMPEANYGGMRAYLKIYEPSN